MTTQSFKWVFCAALFFAVAGSSIAQTRPVKKKVVKPAPTQQSAYGAPAQDNNTAVNSAYGAPAVPDTTGKGNNPSGYNNNNKPVTNINPSLPIEVIKSSGGGMLDSVKVSLRNNAIVDQNLIKEKVPLPYENIREDDAVYRVRVWREIDAREKQNLAFRYSADEDNGNQRFISILLRGIMSGEITAFSGDDDRFTTPITPEAALAAFSGGSDTVARYDKDQNIIGYQVRARAFDPDSVYKFRIKEEWVFDKESSRLFCRILGIAPVIPYYLSNGLKMDNSERPLWWIYYPEARGVFARSEVYNPKNFGAKMSWDDVFDARMFSSYILQSTFDNPANVPLSTVYPNNSLYRLLEGEKIKEKIFNYEQSLWSY